ncbi:MAG: amino acid ABC transporter substrate-binding protein [Spirochaetaceae bacterium]|nr:amino acid ABC transporter substrate-binding protein [Spirochaetaceae bacterium]
MEIKRKIVIFIQIILFSQLILAEDFSNLPPDIRAIKERGYIIVSMYYKDVIPFMFHDQDGNFIGHEVELAKKIAETLGVGYQFDRSPQTFDEIVDLVAEGKADMAISLLSRTLSRAQSVRFTKPYIILRPTLLISRLAASRYDLDPLQPVASMSAYPLSIAEKRGTSYVDKAKSLYPASSIEEYTEWEDAIDAVLDINNPAEIVIRDEIGIKNYISEFPEKSINLQMIPIADERYEDPLAIAVNKDSVHLQEWLNLYFEQYGITGTADRLLAPYEKYYE